MHFIDLSLMNFYLKCIHVGVHINICVDRPYTSLMGYLGFCTIPKTILKVQIKMCELLLQCLKDTSNVRC